MTSFLRVFVLVLGLVLGMTAATDPGLGIELAEAKKSKRKKEKPINSEKKESRCGWLQTTDGEPHNEEHAVQLKLGPPGAQNGHSNPLGVPPQVQDIEISYVHRCGIEGNISVVPGITGGLRYKAGKYFYGSAGAGILITANGIGPGLYTAIGINAARVWPVTFDVEFKQAIGVGSGVGKTQVITPYAFRLGASYQW